jgi:adenosylcobinamide-phosphate synthase
MIYATPFELAAGALLDVLVGDPHWLPHPIRGIGAVTSSFERLLRKIPYEKAGGCMLPALVLLVVIAVVAFTLQWAGSAAAVYWIFSCLAARCLDRESKRVVHALERGDLDRARTLVGRIVGRDTKNMTEQDVTRAVFETVAENMNDAIVAPLFFLAILGIPGMVAYKAINTMDSMVGYKNERYIRFGWASARLDDIANYVPARITAALIVAMAAVMRLQWRNAISAIARDARLQPSPNAGYPEAALAGALGVQLGGLNYYFGEPVQKPFLGDAIHPLHWRSFVRVRFLLYGVSAISYLLVGIWLQLL